MKSSWVVNSSLFRQLPCSQVSRLTCPRCSLNRTKVREGKQGCLKQGKHGLMRKYLDPDISLAEKSILRGVYSNPKKWSCSDWRWGCQRRGDQWQVWGPRGATINMSELPGNGALNTLKHQIPMVLLVYDGLFSWIMIIFQPQGKKVFTHNHI